MAHKSSAVDALLSIMWSKFYYQTSYLNLKASLNKQASKKANECVVRMSELIEAIHNHVYVIRQ